MNKNNYLSDDEIFEIECALYNNVPTPLDKWIPEPLEEDTWLEDQLLEGEVAIESSQDNYVWTNFGRSFNIKYKRMLKGTILPKDFIMVFREDRLKTSELFKENGFEFNYKEILDRYKKYKWPLIIPNSYRKKLSL